MAMVVSFIVIITNCSSISSTEADVTMRIEKARGGGLSMVLTLFGSKHCQRTSSENSSRLQLHCI